MLPDFTKLTPTQFENLTYDLLSARGLTNATWRTPGADGGRDIEGTWSHIDLSGEQSNQLWYIDSKHYSSALNWPTIYEKISYAATGNADYLLIVCSLSVSPACRNEITKWNTTNSKPKVRVWEGHYISNMLIEYPKISAKYGFSSNEIFHIPGILDLTIETSKAAAAAYTRHNLIEETPASKELELASALAWFTAEKTEKFQKHKNLLSIEEFSFSKDGYEWIDWEGDENIKLDSASLRTIFCLIRINCKEERIKIKSNKNQIEFELQKTLSQKITRIINNICLIGNLELSLTESSLILNGAKHG